MIPQSLSNSWQVVPKDPFLEPIAFVKALAAFYHKTQSSSSHSHFLPPTSPTVPSSSNGSSNPGLPVPPTLGSSASPPNTVFLTQSLIESIESHYEKSRQSESYKVHRVLKNKLEALKKKGFEALPAMTTRVVPRTRIMTRVVVGSLQRSRKDLLRSTLLLLLGSLHSWPIAGMQNEPPASQSFPVRR